MALETLKDVTEIDGFKIGSDVTDDETPIKINYISNVICFRIQNGPIKENGVNGCQIDTIIQTAAMILQGLDMKFPCEENRHAVTHLMSAIGALHRRKMDRETRGVEGTNEF